MSNYLAIATVTAVLRELLQSNTGLDQAHVSVGPPGGQAGGEAHVNIFLYQVAVNSTWRNSDLPTRNQNGVLVTKPRIALDLHYLLTFYGSDYEPQRLLGRTVSTLHARPTLTAKQIKEVVEEQDDLTGSDLFEQVEQIRFSPLPLDLEEMSKLWSVLVQTEYALSVTYKASAVLIEADVAPHKPLPVRGRGVQGTPRGIPQIERVSPQFIDYPKSDSKPAEKQVTIHGRNLAIAPKTVIKLDKAIITDFETDRSGNVVFELPDATKAPDLRAGMLQLLLIHEWELPAPEAETEGNLRQPLPVSSPESRQMASNAAALVLRPRVTKAAATGAGVAQRTRLVLTIAPPIRAQQRVTVLLNAWLPTSPADNPPPPAGYSYTLPQWVQDSQVIETAFGQVQRVQINQVGDNDAQGQPLPIPTGQSHLQIDIQDLPPAIYLVRIQVDGAISPLTVDADGRYSQPQVTV